MFKFKSLSSFEIKGRGKVFVVESPLSCNRNDVLMFLGELVEIDGEEYKPVGVEVISLGSPLHIGENIGILVAPNTAYTRQETGDGKSDSLSKTAVSCGQRKPLDKLTNIRI